MIEELNPPAVQAALSTKWLGRRYLHFSTIGSTNLRLEEMVANGNEEDPPEGTVLLAEYQGQGRGRMGRRWLSPPHSSLLFSCLFRPGWAANKAQWLTMIAGLATAEAIEETTPLAAAIKWPNDLMLELDGTWRKVCGLLLQGKVDDDGRLESVIMGIGINVNIPAEQLPAADTPATSLLVAMGRPHSRLALLAALLSRLEQRYEAADLGQSPQPAWKNRLLTLGRPVIVQKPGDQPALAGRAEDVDDWGHLLVRDKSGKLHTVSAADVTLREESRY